MSFFTEPQYGSSFWWGIALSVVGWLVLMAVLHAAGNTTRKRITKFLAFLGGAYYLLEFLLPGQILLGAHLITLDGVRQSAYVKSVRSGSAAERAGIQPGDYVLTWAGQPTPDADALTAAVAAAHRGQPAAVTVRRNGRTVPVTLDVPGAPVRMRWVVKDGKRVQEPVPPPEANLRTLGMRVQNIGNPLSPYIEPLGAAQKIFLGLALMLGVVNLFRINGRALLRRRAGSWYSWVFFAGFFAMAAAWALNYYQWGVPGDLTITARDAQQLGLDIGRRREVYAGLYQVMYEGFFNGLSATMFSMLAFFIVSAAYRAFRVRNPEAVLLLVSAVVMMLGLTPLGTYFITGWISPDSRLAFLKLDYITEWILSVLNGACQRALLFGVAMGLMATGLRIWLSLEQGQFFDAEV